MTALVPSAHDTDKTDSSKGDETNPLRMSTQQQKDVVSILMHQTSIDKDGDVQISQEEMNKWLIDKGIDKTLVTHYKKILIGFAAFSFLIVVLLSIVTFGAVQGLKEVHVVGNELADGNGNSVQCSSKEMAISDTGVLKSKKNQAPVHTLSAPCVQQALNSKVPDK